MQPEGEESGASPGTKRKLAPPDVPPKRARVGPLSHDIISLTGVPSAEKAALGERLRRLGAVLSDELTEQVTLLIARHSNTEKVKAACSAGIDTVTVEWAAACEDEKERVDPADEQWKLKPLANFTVITSGFSGDDFSMHAAIAAQGGKSMGSIVKGLHSGRTVVLVKSGVSVSMREVLDREVVKSALKQCIPVVWEEWLRSVVATGYVSDAIVTQYSLIDSEPKVTSQVDSATKVRLKQVFDRPRKRRQPLPLAGLSFYVHAGDAEGECLDWIDACLANLGATKTLTVTLLTTHVLVASPGSRQLLQKQRIAQVISGSLTPHASLVFPPSNVVTADWLFACAFAGKRLPCPLHHQFSLASDSLGAQPPPGGAAPGGLFSAAGGAAPAFPGQGGRKEGKLGGTELASGIGARFSVGGGEARKQQPPPPPPQGAAEAGKKSEKRVLSPLEAAAAASGVDLKRARREFGSSAMFRGKRFVVSASYSKSGRATAAKIIFAHEGACIRQGAAITKEDGEEAAAAGDTAEPRAVHFFVVPHHNNRDATLGRQPVDFTPPANATTVTEDYLSLCLNYAKALKELTVEPDEAVFREKAAAWEAALGLPGGLGHSEAVIHVSKLLTGLENGEEGALPDPGLHFLYRTAVHRRVVTGETVVDGVKPSPFLIHGQLRTVKRGGVGIAVCFEGLSFFDRVLCGKAVQLLGGSVMERFDSHVTTHVVTPQAYERSERGARSKLLKEAKACAESGGTNVVFGVEPSWVEESAAKGFFNDETRHVLFPSNRVRARAERQYVDSEDQDTPLVKSKGKADDKTAMEPPTPSPRGRLNFDTTVHRDPGGGGHKICLSLSSSASVLSAPCPPADTFADIVSALGGTTVQSITDATHLVASHLGTTQNLCCALAAGKWIVSPTWLLDSSAKKTFLGEEKYEWNPATVADALAKKKVDAGSKEGAKVLSLAGAVEHWRKHTGGGAFSSWRVSLCANDVFASVLKAGGATIVSRELPLTWADACESCIVVMDKAFWKSLSDDARRAIGVFNSIRHAELAKRDPPLSIDQQLGQFFFVDIINTHLQRSLDVDYTKLLAGYKTDLEHREVPTVPW
ncbi:topoisomerase (DNA) II binding protein 1 [Diplonema papillatum]|nr:topoisomerase (DNA) II binding protein 1 [Diplonema papillatum]|eukprot:gene16230-24876_t